MTYIEVTARSHPKVYQALDLISHDQGAGAGHDTYAVPIEYEDKLPAIESALGTIHPTQFQTFCIGDEAVQKRIAATCPELSDASNFLDAFFEDFDL